MSKLYQAGKVHVVHGDKKPTECINSETIRGIEAKITEIETFVGSRLDHFQEQIELRFSHIDDSIEQLRDGHKSVINEVRESVKEVLAAYIAGQDLKIKVVTDAVADEIAATDKRFIETHASIGRLSERLGRSEAKHDDLAKKHDDLDGRVKNKELVEAANNWKVAKAIIITGIISAVVTAMIANGKDILKFLTQGGSNV